MGNKRSVHEYSYFAGSGSIRIGNFVAIANGCTFISETHNFQDTSTCIKKQGLTVEPIIIEDDVWLGSRTVVLGGVRIGTGSVVGAGSVVTRDIPPYSVAVGVPCKVIKNRKQSKG
jgi:acetyltransferase-like isoleucine patch superfamily enzyme